MKIAIITDQHFGCRKNSKLFHDYFLKFYENVFFPTLEKEGITTVINMDNVLTMSESSDIQMIQMYQRFVQDSSKDRDNQPKLSRKMGYITTVNDAKDILEKLYKSSPNKKGSS